MEEAICFSCNNRRLYGILHFPEQIHTPGIIVTMVVGGPQTRIGSHRLYVRLARFLCDNEIPVLRFDYEGIGDSEGNFAGFQHAGPSIEAALEFLALRFNSQFRNILWSLCDGASASLLYAAANPSHIIGMILCNPIFHFDSARYKQQYFKTRLFRKDFWKNLVQLKTNFSGSALDLIDIVKTKLKDGDTKKLNNNNISIEDSIMEKFVSYRIPTKFILSTDDLISKEFRHIADNNKQIKKLFKAKMFTKSLIKSADHTFTNPRFQNELFLATLSAIGEF